MIALFVFQLLVSDFWIYALPEAIIILRSVALLLIPGGSPLGRLQAEPTALLTFLYSSSTCIVYVPKIANSGATSDLLSSPYVRPDDIYIYTQIDITHIHT